MSLNEFKETLQRIYENAVAKDREIKSWNKVYQFVVEGVGDFYIEISNGTMKIADGKHPNPIATLSASPDVIKKIVSGELDSMKAFMSRQLKITGNVLDTVNLKKLIDLGLGKQ
ncbi:MAG: SCP2 sterol-binding domain-containing protein [Caldisphaeraceae archaeon]|nr:SCP2 sterol-binding domain-containing protein [Caldisphaeraceae archaeon]